MYRALRTPCQTRSRGRYRLLSHNAEKLQSYIYRLDGQRLKRPVCVPEKCRDAVRPPVGSLSETGGFGRIEPLPQRMSGCGMWVELFLLYL